VKRAIAVFVVAVAALLLGQATTLILSVLHELKPAAATVLLPPPGVDIDHCARADTRARGQRCA
jgi:hypothetical protein